MKLKSLFLTLIFSICTLSLSAADFARVGFCDNSGAIGDKPISLDAGQNYSAAISLTADDLSRYTNGKFHGINVGLSEKFGVSKIEAWVRTDLNGANLVEATKTSGFNKGWNEILFDAPVDIVSATGYYVGYTVTMNMKSGYLGVQSKIVHAGANHLKIGNGAWEDKSADYGALTLEACISADNLSQNNLTLLSASFAGDHITTDAPVKVIYRVKNSGLQTVKSFKITLEEKDKNVSITHDVSCDIDYSNTADMTQDFILKEFVDGYYNFTLRVEMPNNVADDDADDNTVKMSPIEYSSKLFKRTIVIEEFTTERCVNCPGAAKNMHDAYNSLSDDRKAHVAIICHHSGYNTDFLTQECDVAYLNFYGASGRVFAPAYMLDRVPHTGELGYVPVRQVPSSSGLVSNINERLNVPASYSVDIHGEHDAGSRSVKLDIDMEKALDYLDEPRIVVYLLEDEVPASNNGLGQSGANAVFYHSHVERAYSSIWGENITWNADGKSTYSCTLQYPEGCNPDNMELVAMICNVGYEDFSNYEVGNAAKVRLNGLTKTAVENITAAGVDVCSENGVIRIDGEYDRAEIFDLAGRSVENYNLNRGIYIVKIIVGDAVVCKKVMVK